MPGLGSSGGTTRYRVIKKPRAKLVSTLCWSEPRKCSFLAGEFQSLSIGDLLEHSLSFHPQPFACVAILLRRHLRLLLPSKSNLYVWTWLLSWMQAWAKLEHVAGNLTGARVLFERGIGANPRSVPCLQVPLNFVSWVENLLRHGSLLWASFSVLYYTHFDSPGCWSPSEGRNGRPSWTWFSAHLKEDGFQMVTISN